MPKYVKTNQTRLFSIKNRAGPANAAAYQGCWKAGTVTKPRGEPTIVTCPDPDNYGGFKIVDKIPGDIGLPGLTVTARYEMDLSELLAIFNRGCDVDLQVHIGDCQNPQDFNKGWEKVMVLEAAQPGDYSIGDFGILEQGEQAPVIEEMPFRGEELYEIKRIIFTEQAEAAVIQEILAIVTCDAVSCGLCEDPSDGCEKVFAITITVGGSPGARAELIYTGDGGTVWADTEIDTLAADEDPTDLACVGLNVVVISNDGDNLHWAAKADILRAAETWVAVTTGFIAAGSPNAIISLSPRHTWIVGDGGYIYFTEDPTVSVTVQDAGVVSTDNFNAIHGYDLENLVAVGANNSMVLTRNGGDTWADVVGPNVGISLSSIWMRGPDEWFVGCADGTLWYTVNAGLDWTQKVIPGTYTDIEDIKFSTPTVGWLSAVAAGPAGRILRTIDGGNSWYVAPEGNTNLPANDSINEIAVCPGEPNVIYAGGLADDGTDGIIVKGA